MIRFTDSGQPEAMAEVISAYLTKAMGYTEAGIRPDKTDAGPTLPAELVEALDDDDELARAFHALTPGRQKSYLIKLNFAKKPETRIAWIARYRDRIIAGKGADEY